MAEGDGTPSPEQRHTGVVRRSDLTRPRRSTARQDWLALVGVATLMAIVLVVVANMFGGRQVAQPSSTPSLVAVASPTLKPTYSAEPTRTPSPSPTPSPTPPPTPTPSPSPTPSPTPAPTPSPAPTASPAPLPTQPTVGLIILYPIEGSSVAERVITVRGLSQPGAQITRDVPFWLDSYATADGAGLWSMNIELNIGQNALKFRVGNDFSTTVTLNIHYAG